MKKILKKVKSLIKLVIVNPIDRWRFIHGKDIKRLIELAERKKILVLDTPTHGNLGDQAITFADMNFVKSCVTDEVILEFTYRQCFLALDVIGKYVKGDDVIVLPGGGFLGSLWMNEEELFLKIVQRFKNNKIIVFPHTVFFENDDRGKREFERLKEVLSQCEHLYFFSRDKFTYDILTQEMRLDNERVQLCPDIVTSISYPGDFDCKDKENVTRSDVALICLRDDKECVRNNVVAEFLISEAKSKYQLKETTTYSVRTIMPNEREGAICDKLNEFASARLVITDRLHAMLFATITGTPCIAMDNLSKKISQTYHLWLQNFGYIKFVDEQNYEFLDINKLVEKEYSYDFSDFGSYYGAIRECFKEKIV